MYQTLATFWHDEAVVCCVVAVEQSTAKLGRLQDVLLVFKQQNSMLLSRVMPQNGTDTHNIDMSAYQVSYIKQYVHSTIYRYTCLCLVVLIKFMIYTLQN